MTRTGDVLGTPVYMAPEQAGGRKDLDGRIDVYALGVILYECLSGRPPYLEASWLAMRQAIMNGKPTPPSALRAEIPRGVEAVCLQAMAARREDRIQSAAALATALTDLEANLADRNADADADETHVERGQARRVSSRRSSAPEAADWRPSPLQIAGAAVFALALVGGTIGVMSLGADVASLEPISAAKVGESIVLQDSARAPAPTPLAETASRRAKANGAFTSALALARDAARSRKPTPEVLALLERADGLALNEEAMAEALAVRVALRFHRLEMRKVIGLVPPDTSSLTLLLLRSIAMGVDGKAAEAAPGLKRIAAEGGAMRNAAEAVRAYYAKDARRAEYEARRALEESPGLSSIRIVLAIVLLNGADGETLAGPEIEKILKDRPDDVMALHVDGKLLAVGGKFDEALERFKLARSLGTPLGMQNDYAEALLFKTTPRPRLAIEELTTFIDRAGNRPAACQPLVLRAIAWALEEEIDRGGADVKKAVELGGWAALRVAKIYRRRGLVDDDVLHRLRDAAGLGDWGRRNRGRRGRDGDRGRKRDYDRD
jgi:tetratricopeptide (TPR) repeat protein